MNLQTPSLDTVSPGERIVKKPFRKPVFVFCPNDLIQQHSICPNVVTSSDVM